MSVSSGTVSLFATVAFCIAAAGATAYGFKHKAEVQRLLTEVTGVKLVAMPSDQDPQSGITADSDSDAPEMPGDVTLRATHGGHFETSVEVNGRSIDVMVDTGATLVALTYEDAERAGLYPKPSDFTHSVSTANGVAKVAPVDIGSISIGGITVRNVRGAITERGKLHRTLLGMSFLGKLSRVEMRKDALVLHE